MTATDEHVDERSPLVTASNTPVDGASSPTGHGATSRDGDAPVPGRRHHEDDAPKSSWYLFLLTLSIGGYVPSYVLHCYGYILRMSQITVSFL